MAITPEAVSYTHLDVYKRQIRRSVPITATTAEIVAVERMFAIPPEPLIYERQSIQPVILVPILAPMIIPIACFSFIIPELTKPITITVVAEED